MKLLAIFGGIMLLLIFALWIAAKTLQRSGFVVDKDGKFVQKGDAQIGAIA